MSTAAGAGGYAVRNVTTGKTSGAFPSVEAAQDALTDHVGADDEWEIWEIPAESGAERKALSGRGLVGG